MLKTLITSRLIRYLIIVPVAGLSIILLTAYLSYPKTTPTMTRPTSSPYPNGKNFAFTITDDADSHRTDRLKPVYTFLTKLGIRSTIAVWVLDPVTSKSDKDIVAMSGLEQHDSGDSLQNEEYQKFILGLRDKGFEIGLHTVTGGTDLRETTILGYEKFKSIIGTDPNVNIMHSNNLEDIYWGSNVFSNPKAHWFFKNVIGTVYSKARLPFGGEDPDSPYFWGDIAKAKTKYVRMWGTSGINTLAFNPGMPYHDPGKPYVNYWFSFSDGFTIDYFNQIITDENIKKLVDERGASIVYTHFAVFSEKKPDGTFEVDQLFKNQMEKLSKQKDPWFVPVSTLLDRLLLIKNVTVSNSKEAVFIRNVNNSIVDGYTLLTEPDSKLYGENGKVYSANEEGEMILGKLLPNTLITLKKKSDSLAPAHDIPVKPEPHNNQLGFIENANLILGRILILLFAHSG